MGIIRKGSKVLKEVALGGVTGKKDNVNQAVENEDQAKQHLKSLKSSMKSMSDEEASKHRQELKDAKKAVHDARVAECESVLDINTGSLGKDVEAKVNGLVGVDNQDSGFGLG